MSDVTALSDLGDLDLTISHFRPGALARFLNDHARPSGFGLAWGFTVKTARLHGRRQDFERLCDGLAACREWLWSGEQSEVYLEAAARALARYNRGTRTHHRSAAQHVHERNSARASATWRVQTLLLLAFCRRNRLSPTAPLTWRLSRRVLREILGSGRGDPGYDIQTQEQASGARLVGNMISRFRRLRREYGDQYPDQLALNCWERVSQQLAWTD